MILTVGALTGKQEKAGCIVKEITNRFAAIPAVPKIKSCYLIWREPFMTVGGDTFISNMLDYAGFENVFAAATRYPEIDLQDLKNSGCEMILLSSEPYPFKEKHIEEIRSVLPGMQIRLVDGELFSWYGSRLSEAPDYFKSLNRNFTH
jgi:ABC-type Fe3+-hydroxamate transport system substrate-binding protein